ncbi:MAG: peptide ABC transporter substrate-binding protein [Gammaproteobacteria bacterium]|nr:peptide ABC transporter substrate-binding protein [Gammaproteobacteria bacterium]MDH4310004.1 peptide ABC transporter substrate-binding protein [Gammaproteobacteria bacterium]MDH5271699.1 peptide ABC transporter substrate-binding protein [Gammaproteobacteria bacterium]
MSSAWVIGLSAVVLAVAGCGGRDGDASKTGSAAKTGSTVPSDFDPTVLRRGNGPEPETLDPQLARTEGAFHILRDVFEGLTSIGPDGSPVPAAAESWTVTPDGLEYRFTLRDGLRWSNGDVLRAADFVAGMRRLVDPNTASPYAHFIDPVLNAGAITRGEMKLGDLGVSAPDDRTVLIRLATPAPYLLGLLSQPGTFPVHGPSLAAHGAEYARPGKLVSNGAFVLADWVIGSHVVLRRNAHYWNNAATGLEAVHFVHIADAGTELRQYRAGQLDFTYVVPAPLFQWIKQNLPDELHIAPQLSVYYYGFNLTRPPFKDNPKLRRALSLAIDRDKLTTAVTGVGEAPAYGWVPRGVWNYTPQRFDYAGKPYAERLAEARRLYAEAGYSAAQPLRIELRYNSGDQHNRLAVAVAAMWKEGLGVETTLYAEEFRALLQSIQARRDTQVFRSSWVGDFNDAYTFAQLLQTNFGINLSGYSNPRYDALLADAVRQADAAKRRALLEEAERVMLADHPVLPLYFYVNKHLVKPWVRGWTDNVMNVVYSKDLRLERPAR